MKLSAICFNGMHLLVRWTYTAKSHNELTVRIGDEVEILKTGTKDIFYKVLS